MAGNLAFRPEQRLHHGSEFAAVLGGRRRVRGQVFELRCIDSSAATARLGLVVAKRLAKRANLRNTVKRLAREAFRHLNGRLPPIDLVVRLSGRIDPQLKVDPAVRKAWRAELEQLMLRFAA